jgi:hypothetical protein
MSADNIEVTIDDQIYEWVGGFGSILKSWERGVRVGDVRCIYGEFFHARFIYDNSWTWFARMEVCWTLRDVSVERIQEFRQSLLGVR